MRLHAGALILLAALALAALAAAPAFAAPSSPPVVFALSPAGAPGPVLLRGAGGRVLRGAVTLRNLSRHPITVILQPADLQNASNGNADYVTTRLSNAGRWLRLSAQTVRLASHATRRVAFTVRIPAGSTGASHYAGIVAINAADLATATAHRKTKGTAFTFYRINRQALPLTIRLPGGLTRYLTLRSVALSVQPPGAGLVLDLAPGGSELTQSAQIQLRVLRGAHTIFSSSSTLGQLFPSGVLNYRIPWPGRPTPGSYQVLGTIRPQGSAAIKFNQTVHMTAAKAAKLTRETPPVAQPPTAPTPGWVWIALAGAVVLLIALPLAVWKLARRPTAVT